MTPVPENSCILHHDSIFKHLTQSELIRLKLQMETGNFKKGEVIFEENHRLKGVYIVQSGVIKMYKTGMDGRDQIIRFAQAGDLIGFRSVLSEEPACTSAKVVDNATLCYLPAEYLSLLVKDNGNFAMALLKVVCTELGQANDFITDIAQKSVRQRLAEVILYLNKQFGKDKENYTNISLTREEISNIVGTATESIIRLLSEFKSVGLLEMKGRKLKILKETELYRISNEL